MKNKFIKDVSKRTFINSMMHFQCKRFDKNNLLNNKKKGKIYIYIRNNFMFFYDKRIYIYMKKEQSKKKRRVKKNK